MEAAVRALPQWARERWTELAGMAMDDGLEQRYADQVALREVRRIMRERKETR